MKLLEIFGLTLFNQKIEEENFLYCYVDLFSTFQYYVLLNSNYKGEDIHEVYHQTVIKQYIEKIDVRRVRPKHLSIIVNDYNIDTTKYKGENLSEFYDFLDREIRNHQFESILDFQTELKKCLTEYLCPCL
jgi:hypothetical protein